MLAWALLKAKNIDNVNIWINPPIFFVSRGQTPWYMTPISDTQLCRELYIKLLYKSIFVLNNLEKQKKNSIFATKMNKKVLKSIRELLAQTLPPYATARLYGSRARGDAHRGSDWDILIVMDKDQLLPDDYDTVTYPLTKLGWELGAEINPIMYTKKEWEQSRITPFYHNVEQDAIAL